MAFWAALPGAITIGTEFFGSVGGLFGGGTPETEKAAQYPGYRPPSDYVPMLTYGTAGELEELRRNYAAANTHMPNNWNKPDWLAAAYVGGEDGKISSTAGRTLKATLDRLLGKYPPGYGATATAPVGSVTSPPSGNAPAQPTGSGSQAIGGGYGGISGEVGGVSFSGGFGVPPWVWAAGTIAIAIALRGK